MVYDVKLEEQSENPALETSNSGNANNNKNRAGPISSLGPLQENVPSDEFH